MKTPQPAIEPREGLAYRADIDGLRGIAVIAVVLFHAFPNALRGGFVGVDVFFVVSGFLITGIILDDLERGRFRFAHFYARRIRRLFPALAVVLAMSLGVGWVYLLTDEFRQLSKHVAAASVFASNFVLWSESGYFDAEAHAKPLLHLWSLGIEEQFYLAWPLVVWLAWRRRNLLLGIVIALGLASFGWQVLRHIADPVGAFFSPVTRFWELLAGVMLAVMPSSLRQGIAASAGAPVAAAAGLAAIGIACFADTPPDGLSAWRLLAPVAGTWLVIASGPLSIIHRRVLAAPALVWVGLISYPLYLWHWPLLSFAHVFRIDDMPMRIVLVAVSVALAWMTWRFLERPIRIGARANSRIALLVSALAILGIVGLMGASDMLRPLGATQFQEFTADRTWTYTGTPRLRPVEFSDNAFAGAAKLRQDLDKYGKVISFRWIPSQNPKKTLFVGDSHMEQYWARPDQLILEDPARARSAVFLTASSFLPIPAVRTDPARHPEFVGLAQAAIDYALSDDSIDTVVFSSVWSRHMYEFTPLPSGESPYYAIVDGREENLRHGRSANEVAFASLSEMLTRLHRAGKRVFIVMEVVRGNAGIARGITGFSLEAPPTPAARYLGEMSGIRERLTKIAAESGAVVLDPFPLLCPDGVSCPSIYDGIHPVYMDISHLSDRFVRTRATFLDPTILTP